MRVFEEMRRAVEAAPVDRLGAVAAAVWKAYGAGGLTDEQAEKLDGLLNARRSAARAAPVRTPTLAVIAAQVVPAAAPAPEGQGTAPARAAHHGTGSRPRTPASLPRRRRMAAGGYMPPVLASAFTPGEQAVLAVIALEVGKRGKCTLAIGQLAALAGVCATLVKRALRHARTLGLLAVEERRISRSRNDTNVVTIASREWAAWLRLRLPRSNPAVFQGVGGTTMSGTFTGNIRGASINVRPSEIGRPTVRNLTTRPPARAVGA